MAQIIFTGLITSMTGKLAGSFFRRSKGGTSLVPCTTKMTKADSGRANLAEVQAKAVMNSKQWKLLTSADRTAWLAGSADAIFYNKAGQPYVPSAYEFYSKQTLNQRIIGLSPNTTPVVQAVVDDVTKLFVTVGAGPVYDIDTPVAGARTDTIKVFASFPQSAGIKYPKGGYRMLIAIPLATAFPYDLAGDYATVFGFNPPAGVIHWKFQLCNPTSGDVSTAYYTSTAV